MDIAPWVLLGISLLVIAMLSYFLRARRPKKTLEISAQDLLHDLTRRGVAIIRVEVIDATNLLLRSPRG